MLKSESSKTGSVQDAIQEEIEIDIAIAWGNEAVSGSSLGNWFGTDDRSPRSPHSDNSYVNALPYEGTASPCLTHVDVVWSVNRSATEYRLLISSDNINYYPTMGHNVMGKCIKRRCEQM